MSANLNVRIHPFANRRRQSSSSSTTDDTTTNPILRSTTTSDEPTSPLAAATNPSSSGCLPAKNIGCLSPHAPRSSIVRSSASYTAAQRLNGAPEQPESPHHPHRSLTTAHHDVGQQFMRCIHLLNLAVRSQLAPSSAAAGIVACGGPYQQQLDHDGGCGGVGNDGKTQRPRHLSTKVAKLRRMTNVARLEDVARVAITVYRDACTFEDPNGEATHARFLMQYDGAVVDGPYVRGTVTSTAASPVGGGCTAQQRASQDSNGAATPPRAYRRAVGGGASSASSCLFVFDKMDDVQGIVRDVCGTYMPRALEHVYPEGIVLEGHWRGDEAMPSLAALGYASTPWQPLSRSNVGRGNGRNQMMEGPLPTAGADHRSGDADVGGRRLGGAPNKGPHDRRYHAPQDDAAQSAEQSTASLLSTSIVPPSLSSSMARKTQLSDGDDDARVTLLTPIGRLIFCRRQHLDETWGDVRDWLVREVQASFHAPSRCGAADRPDAPSAGTVAFSVGGVGCTAVALENWGSLVGPRGIVVRCTWKHRKEDDGQAVVA